MFCCTHTSRPSLFNSRDNYPAYKIFSKSSNAHFFNSLIPGLNNVLPGKHVAKTIKIIKPRDVREHQTGNINRVVALVMSNHRVYSFELMNNHDLKAMYQMMEAVLGVSMAHQHLDMA